MWFLRIETIINSFPKVLLSSLILLSATGTRATGLQLSDEQTLRERVVTLERALAELRQEVGQLKGCEASESINMAQKKPVEPDQELGVVSVSGEDKTPRSVSVNLRDRLNFFGFFSTRYEREFSVPTRGEGGIIERDSPGELSFPFFHLMANSQLSKNYRVYLNINGDGGGDLDLRNFWGEYSYRDWLNFRLGKMYRQIGLYNQILDTVPSYVGVEPPELLDSDHLLVSRTTNVMIHGAADLPKGRLSYSVSIDDGEGIRLENSYPIGVDMSFSSPADELIVGFSAYDSMGRTSGATRVGEGPPSGGVLPWISNDRFNVLGGYIETRPTMGFQLQAAYWKASHDGWRDPASVIEIIENADLNRAQLSRFLRDSDLPVVAENIETRAKYDIKTWYIRASYSIETRFGEFVPYLLWDWYSNPETIADKDFGGDNEAGLSDDGEFHKPTIGFVYRPIPKIAIKLDGSSHLFKMDGEDVDFPELRLDISFLFGH